MRIQEKADRIAADLAARYPDPPVPLDHRDAYTLLVAVLLSAQCTDKKVNEVTPALFDRAPDPGAMLALGQPAILEIIRPCGLSPGKSRRIVGLSEILLREHAGEVPADIEALERLPGVGHKTASVVMAQAFGEPAFPVDTHIHRLAWRWGLSDGRNVEQTERDLKRRFAPSLWNDLHLQIIFFGREHCTARRHDPAVCPICAWAGVRKRLAAEKAAGIAGPAALKKKPRA